MLILYWPKCGPAADAKIYVFQKMKKEGIFNGLPYLPFFLHRFAVPALQC
jgi:hypothetical protein